MAQSILAALGRTRGIEDVLTKPKCFTPHVGGNSPTQIVEKAIADTLEIVRKTEGES